MAIKAFTRKTSGPTTSDEFLKDYENLLKRNKGGGIFMGYDTSSQTPIYLGTSVADPMGLGQTVDTKTQDNAVVENNDMSQTVDLFTQVLNGLTDDIDSEEVINVYDFLDNYFKNELPNLTEQQQSQVLPSLVNLLNRSAEIITSRSDNMNAYKSGFDNPYSPITPELSKDEFYRNLYNQGQVDQIPFIEANKTIDEANKFVGDTTKWVKDTIKDVKQTNYDLQYDPKYEQARQDAKKYEEIKQRLIKEGKINEAGQNLDKNGNINIGYTGNPDTSDIGEVWYKAPEKEVNVIDEFKNWLSGATSKVGEGIKNARGTAGDFVDSMAYAIPGSENRKDTGFSEWLAGRKTPHTVSAAEPETLQAGSGLTRLRDDMSYSPTALAGRPDFSQIGLKRSIGNVAGIQDQSAITGNKQVSPDGQSISNISRFSQATTPTSTTLPQFSVQEQTQQSTPSKTYSQSDLGAIVDAMMSKGYNNRAEAEAVAKADINRFGNEYLPSGGSSNNVGVGSNQPSTSNSNSSNNSSTLSNYQNKLANTYTAPTTSNNANTLANASKIGTSNYVMPTVGVGSNQPTTSTSSSSNSLMSTISNLLANLFRRK